MAAVNITIGSQVWVEDPNVAWVEAEVLQFNGKQVKARTQDGKTVTSLVANVHPKDTDSQQGGVDDMTKLAYLHEPGVLHNLSTRYELDEIYTYTGNILIAINPFAKLPHLYDNHMMEQYRGAPLGELSPHVFAVADSSYRAMLNEKKSQSILVSGESGAGKTETTKLIMQYLAYMGGRANTDGRTVEQQVLESNPLLEAFGNAKTSRNDNSSRFGKFVEIQFDNNGRISGAAIRTYLLERSRVVQIADPERNYHCFYQLCASAEDSEKYKLGDARTFHYLNQSPVFELNNVNNAREYVKTRRAMDIVGISSDEQEAIFRVVAAILHLGNVEFMAGTEHDSSELKDGQSRFHLGVVAELLNCNEKNLLASLCERTIVTREGNITKTLDPVAAATNRDTLAKTLYSRLFDWLVDKVNKSIGQDPDSTVLVGVLDIYGFESFNVNSFEQFCINLANEKLQQHFNQHVFKMEQDEYTKEAIDWSYIEFVDNQDVLDLVEKKPLGIIALLDEACMFPKSTNETFATKLFQSFSKNKRFSKPKLARTDFTISHYAGDVTYQTELFLDKNKDYVVAEHQALLGSSECSFVACLFPPPSDESSKSSYKFSSIGTRFKQQLQALMETLNTTEPHYIRCVKPNMFNKPGRFEYANVLQQLRCGGVLEAVRISCAGYPTRRTFDEFIDRFSLLAPELLEENYDEKGATEKLLQKMDLTNYQVGKTKVFLRAGQMAELDAKRAEVLGNAARIIQRQVRTYLAQKEFRRKRKATITIQAHWRGRLSRKLYQSMREEAAAVRIQKNVRRWQAQKSYGNKRKASIVIQSGARGMAARNEYRLRRQTKAAIKVQAWWRGYKARSYYNKLRKSAIAFQCGWRSRVARKELKNLKMAAKETGALQAAKTMLEKKCEELTWRLQLEKRMRNDLEDAKSVEVAKLQATILEMQLQVQTASVELSNERASNKAALGQAVLAAERVPSVEVTDAKVDKLVDENSALKAMIEALEKQAAEATDAEKKYAEAKKESEDRARRAEEAEAKVEQMQEAVNRLAYGLRRPMSGLGSQLDGLAPSAQDTKLSSDFLEGSRSLPKNEDRIMNLSALSLSGGLSKPLPLLEMPCETAEDWLVPLSKRLMSLFPDASDRIGPVKLCDPERTLCTLCGDKIQPKSNGYANGALTESSSDIPFSNGSVKGSMIRGQDLRYPRGKPSPKSFSSGEPLTTKALLSVRQLDKVLETSQSLKPLKFRSSVREKSSDSASETSSADAVAPVTPPASHPFLLRGGFRSDQLGISSQVTSSKGRWTPPPSPKRRNSLHSSPSPRLPSPSTKRIPAALSTRLPSSSTKRTGAFASPRLPSPSTKRTVSSTSPRLPSPSTKRTVASTSPRLPSPSTKHTPASALPSLSSPSSQPNLSSSSSRLPSPSLRHTPESSIPKPPSPSIRPSPPPSPRPAKGHLSSPSVKYRTTPPSQSTRIPLKSVDGLLTQFANDQARDQNTDTKRAFSPPPTRLKKPSVIRAIF